MAVVNLDAGAVFNVAANQIHGNAHVYRTGQGYSSPGSVGWVPNGGIAQIQGLAVGHTATFAINNQAGMIANGCPSKVQVLYDNGGALRNADVVEGEAKRLLDGESAKSRPAKARKRRGTASAVADAGDPAEEAITKLTAQWYNAVVNGCHLDPDTFQLIQGATPLGSTSETLWNILDVVPPLSVSNYYNPSQLNVFSTDYGAVINNLKPQNADRFQNDMGDLRSVGRLSENRADDPRRRHPRVVPELGGAQSASRRRPASLYRLSAGVAGRRSRRRPDVAQCRRRRGRQAQGVQCNDRPVAERHRLGPFGQFPDG